MKIFHASVEGAQHGPKGLEVFLQFATNAGAEGCQPCNQMLHHEDGKLMEADFIRGMLSASGLKLDGISAHCPFWVHTTAWTQSPTIRSFIPALLYGANSEQVESATESYLLSFLDLCAELEVKVVPMFWGVAFGWEVATGYPWGFWKGPGYDLIQTGKERFVNKTAKIRNHARHLGIFLAHEIHPGTAAMCADDFMALVEACDNDPCLAVNIDPSHCWEGETWQSRFLNPEISQRCYGCHVKNHTIVDGRPLRCMEPDWQKRGMQFTDLATGDINMVRFVETVMQTGYYGNYLSAMGTETAPLVVEAESAFRDIDATSADGIKYVRDRLCFNVAEGSFEDGMGEKR